MQRRMEPHSGGLSLVFFKRCATQEPLPHFASQTSPSSWPTWHRKDAVCPNIGQTVRSASENQWISMDTNPCRVPFFFVFYAQAWTMPSCPVEMWDLWAKMPCPGLTLGEWMRCDAMMNCAKSTHGRHYAYIRGPLYFAASFPV